MGCVQTIVFGKQKALSGVGCSHKKIPGIEKIRDEVSRFARIRVPIALSSKKHGDPCEVGYPEEILKDEKIERR